MNQKTISPWLLLLFLFSFLTFVLSSSAHGQDLGNNTASPQVSAVVETQTADQISIEEETESSGSLDEVVNEPVSSLLWNLFISLIVLLVTVATVALCVAAMRQWQGYWRAMAGTPIVILLVWVAVIILSVVSRPGSHNLWTFEIFAWAMGTSVYMMLLMTAKKAFNKADAEIAAEAAERQESSE